MKPKLLLLDEPLGALDLTLRRQMQDELKAIQKRVGTAFVHVTHDQEEAMALADLLVVMQEGRIVDQGDPERVYARPATRFSATFMGDNTLIEAEVTEVSGTLATVRTPVGTFRLERPEARVGRAALTIRPESMRLGAAPAGHVSFGVGIVAESMFQGSYRRIVVLSDGGQEIVLRVPPDDPAAIGTRVELHADPRHVGMLAG